MNRRSRGGCIDCRKAKVKCDEIRPFCGTCSRRFKSCQGYAPATAASKNRATARALPGDLTTNTTNTATMMITTTPGSAEQTWSSDTAAAALPIPSLEADDSQLNLVKRPFTRFDDATSMPGREFPKAGHPLIMDPALLSPRALGLIPPGIVNPSDQATVEVYFSRHPSELIIGPEFINEMNANVLIVMQHNPRAIVDSLSGIGHSYLTGSGPDSSVAVLNYRARILATLRSMEHSQYELEDMVVLLLGLCAMELVDSKAAPRESTIPAIIANSAALISHHVSSGRGVSSLARYFIRALARQDMILSLMELRRPMIPTAVWLDEESQTAADRLMGYTTTLMPLLEELCVLAQDVRSLVAQRSRSSAQDSKSTDHPSYQHYQHYDLQAQTSADFVVCMQRADDLGTRIQLWRPTLPRGLSFEASRRFLSQATCYRSGALLYHFRLMNPPGISAESDGEAAAKAHDILMCTTGPSEDVKMLLWPVFVAACEMEVEQDREMVLGVLESISIQRRTVTVQRTKAFVVNRVWRARDEGREWDWMALARNHPGECVPI